ncbi:helix-turn-helix domain-containing protein [Candidatus Poseidoniaceae archaeon]|nr:helix-turn-helix domain-containing protein [Candidatus Poseidoniaceae archaeon]
MVYIRFIPVQCGVFDDFVRAFTATVYHQTITIHWFLFRELQVRGSLQPIMAVQQVRIEVRLPEGHWAGDVTRSHPSAVLRIEEHMPLQKGRGTARASCSEEITATVSEHSGIEEVRSFGKQSFVVDIIAGGGGFLKPLLKVGVIPHTPFEVRDGWVEWTISCAREKVRDLLSGFDDEDIPYQLVSTRGVTNRLLTPRQRYVFDTAMKEGYYDVPRRITLTELAVVLDVAKSTLSAQLHLIESTVHHAFADDIRRRSP